MARISRMCYESSYFHVMIQGIEKKCIFQSSGLKEKYLEFLINSAEKNNVKLIAYCIMDNHVHLLLYTEEINNLSKIMSSVNTRYAKLYNKIQNRCGYVYRDRYRCENIMSQNHLENCIKYIHNNPVDANICDTPSDYEYSSYNSYKNKKIDEDIIKLIFWDPKDYSEKLNSSFEDYNYIEVKNEFGEKKYENINEVFREYSDLNYNDKKVIYNVICNLKKRCNAKNDDIARLLGLNKSAFYRILKEYKKC